jgi:prolyl oligopeptidase
MENSDLEPVTGWRKDSRWAGRVALGITWTWALTAGTAVAAAQSIDVPQTRKGDVVDDYHGTEVSDPYRWLEDTESEETADWVEAENLATFSFLDGISEREIIRQRLTELWDYERYGVPFSEAGRYFYFKNDGLQNQSVLYVQEGLGEEGRALLDPNALSEDGTVALTTVSVTESGEYVGYGTAAGGSDWREFHIRRVSDGEDLPDRIRWVKFSGLSWTKDGSGFFYSRYPEASVEDSLLGQNRKQMLYYHRAGTPGAHLLPGYRRRRRPPVGRGDRAAARRLRRLLQLHR